ncbi:MAG: diguanylate cyclase [Candidatus Omnitrophota bacterium]|nr:diguanylate cyclase [Candidatus Omnitrophota bacterium]
MKGFFKRMSLAPKGLRYKLVIAFSLMSIIPIMACAYLIFSHTFPMMTDLINVTTVVMLSIIISVLGLVLARGMVDPVINMAIEAKMIASGEFDREISVSRDDEVGILGESINTMTHKIRLNLDELKSFSQRTKELNVEIHKKVLALSSLLQIGDLIATGSANLDSVLELSVQKVAMILDGGFCVLYMIPKEESSEFLPKAYSNIQEETLLDIIVKKGEGLLGRIMDEKKLFVVDNTVKMTREVEEFKMACNVKNMLAIPIYSGKRNFGLLVVGNKQDDYRYRVDDLDLIKIFAKQITIAIENDIWIKKSEELSIKDDLTDLYSKSYVLSRLDEEIRRAIFYQRPCSFILLSIDNSKSLREKRGELVTEDVIKRVAKLVKENTTPVGKAARISGKEFGMLLPEKNKREAAHIAENVRKQIETTNFSREGDLKITVSGGVSENPIDGSTQEELFKKATELLASAKSMGKNRVAA